MRKTVIILVMKELEERIRELLAEADDAPSFGGDDSGSDNTENSSSEDNSSDVSSDDTSSEDGPSFGSDDSSGDSSDSSNSDDSNGDSSDNSSDGNSADEKSDENDDSKEDDKKDDEEKEEKEEEFKAKSFDDFLKQTESKIKITKISSEPSPIFGSNDTKNHNKYKVTITNEKGSVWFHFWDSLHNTENNKKPSQDDVLACFGMDVGSVMDGVSKDEFKEMAGYDKSEDSLAQKAYDGCQKMLSRAKKLFEEDQIKELLRLSQEH